MTFRNDGAGASNITSTGNINTNFQIIRCRRDDTTQAISIDSATEDSNTNATNATITSLDIGGSGTSLSLQGKIAEVIVYSRSLTSTEIARIEGYLTRKWLGFTIPTDIGDCELWLDSSDSSTITETSGSVSQWNDKSGNGNNATQGVGANQPTTGTSNQNGNNVLDFADDQFLELPSDLYPIPSDDNTVFVVSRRNSETGSVAAAFAGAGGGQNRWITFYNTTVGSISFRNDGAGASSVSSSGNTNTQFQIIRGRREGTTQAIAINSGSESSNTNATNATITSLDIGGVGTSLSLEGEVAEVIVYSRSLTSTEISDVENYLAAKWGISV